MSKRIWVRLACVVVAGVVGGCGSGTEKAATEPAPREATPAGDPPAAPAGPAVQSTQAIRFVVNDSDRRQSLELRKRDDGGFDVALSATGACSRSETGSAKAVVVEGDGDVEVDPDGEGHPVDAFVFTQGNCSVTIRLAAPEQDYAWLREAGCSTDCPLSGNAMTRE